MAGADGNSLWSLWSQDSVLSSGSVLSFMARGGVLSGGRAAQRTAVGR